MRHFVSLVLLLCASAFAQLPQNFFTLSTANTADMPKVPYGTLGHPGSLVWTAVETSRGFYNWKQIDGFVKKAPHDSNGVAQIDLTLGYTPGWAVANQSSCRKLANGLLACTAPPDNLQDWTDFVSALISHYNGISAPHVAFYEIWNEANMLQFWSGTVSQLATMGAAAYPILKSDPYSQVLTPSVVWQAGNGLAFTQSYLSAAPADAVSFHAYTCKTNLKSSGGCAMPESAGSSNAPLQTMIQSFAQIANSLPLFISEGGWGVHGVTDPDLQAAWAAHYLVLGASFAQSANLTHLAWFEWGVPTMALSGNIEASSGQPNAAGIAYGVVQSWLNSNAISSCSVSGTIWSCAAGANLIVWDASQSCSNGVCTTSPYLVTGFSSYQDIAGENLVVENGSVDLGIKPLLLEP